MFYLPWTKEALTVHLHAPLDEAQMEDAESAEYIEKKEGLTPISNTSGESMYLDFDMGTDLVKPDVFTKQMYMRVFIRHVLDLDKSLSVSMASRSRLGTAYDDLLSSKKRGNSVYGEMVVKEERRVVSSPPQSKKPIKSIFFERVLRLDTTGYHPAGDMVKCFTAYADSSVNCLVKVPVALCYWE